MVLWLSTLACRGADADLPPPYRDLSVPKERLESAEARQRGQLLFRQHCVLCHGIRGDGRGERREGFVRQPRDFTSIEWKRAATPRRVFYALKEGVRGTAMPSWRTLEDSDLWDLSAYVLSIARMGP